MKTLILPFRKNERGQSLMEFAISLIILLMLLTGSVEFGLALFQYVTIRDAAQEGAVYGSIAPDDEAGIQWRVVDAASDVVQLTPASVTVRINTAAQSYTVADAIVNGFACEGSTGIAPDEVANSITVTAEFRHPVTYPFVADMINEGSILLRGSSTTTILQPTCETP